ncbi:MAG: peptidoglycan-binding domain-containing protein [Bryobacteraceae bacterium]
MRPFQYICVLALALSQFVYGAAAKKPVAAAKKTSPASRGTAKASAAKSTGTKATGAARTTRARSRSGASARARTFSPPRQQTPTTERYAEIQKALIEKGYFKGDPNGAWGADSVDALKRFQGANNLTPDGKIGALSLIGLGLGPKHESTAEIAVTPKPMDEGKQ